MCRRSILVGASLGALGLVLAVSVAARVGLVAVELPDPRPDGVFLWMISRALGVTAYFALTLEVLLGLALSTGAGDRLLARARSVELHRGLSSAALGLTFAHAVALLGDRFVRFDLLDLLVPFVAPYRPVAVGVGVLAAWAAFVVHASFLVRKRIGPRIWRALHYLAFLLYAAATAHGLAAGTDAGATWMQAAYATSVGAVLALLTLRVRRASRAPREDREGVSRPRPIV
jgi:sulfoxide reductase heme-binding subunit YedZ